MNISHEQLTSGHVRAILFRPINLPSICHGNHIDYERKKTAEIYVLFYWYVPAAIYRLAYSVEKNKPKHLFVRNDAKGKTVTQCVIKSTSSFFLTDVKSSNFFRKADSFHYSNTFWYTCIAKFRYCTIPGGNKETFSTCFNFLIKNCPIFFPRDHVYKNEYNEYSKNPRIRNCGWTTCRLKLAN